MLEIKTKSHERFKVSQERMEICETCEHYNERTTQCRECGCFMKVKTLMMEQVCPLGKWGKHTFPETKT